jgi:hypothetical protein
VPGYTRRYPTTFKPTTLRVLRASQADVRIRSATLRLGLKTFAGEATVDEHLTLNQAIREVATTSARTTHSTVA